MVKTRESGDLGGQDDVNCNRALGLGRSFDLALAADRSLLVRAGRKRRPGNLSSSRIPARVRGPAPARQDHQYAPECRNSASTARHALAAYRLTLAVGLAGAAVTAATSFYFHKHGLVRGASRTRS